MSHPLKWLALVALERAETPTFETISEWLRSNFAESIALSAAGATENLLTLTIGDYTAAVTLVPRPIPSSQLEGPAATAWYWPEAAQELHRHSAHFLITVIDEGGSAITKAKALTQLTAAVAATSASVGIFWGPGRLVHSPSAFVDQVLQMRDENLPLFLWIDFRLEQIGDGNYQLYTTGLEALGQSELEVAAFDGPPQELLDFSYNIAHYLLEKRKVVRDGDTIGLTEEVRATARLDKSMLDPALDVIRLEFERG
jgi:hypothetical protein